MQKVYVFLSHDVDWPRHGPGVDHVLARRERFDEGVIERVLREGFNPYYNIPLIVEAEERVGIRSTFFFRPVYDDGTGVECYEDDIRELARGGWEVGVHLNSADSVGEVAKQKRKVEAVLVGECAGCRVHYLRVDERGFERIAAAGFRYDSSLVYSRDRVDPRNMGCVRVGGLIVFPITLMDAYMFAYMGVSEDRVLDVVGRALDEAARLGKPFVTLLWHVGSVRMRGGRAYFRVLEYLASRDDVKVIRGVDAYSIAVREGLCRDA